jgi:hypothetical protein
MIGAARAAVETVGVGWRLAVAEVAGMAASPDAACHARFLDGLADHDAILLELLGENGVKEGVETAVQRQDEHSENLVHNFLYLVFHFHIIFNNYIINIISNYIILVVLMRFQNSGLISLDSGLFFTKLRDIPWFYTNLQWFTAYTANEGPARIQYKCLVPIYVFPEMKLCSLLISKTEL